MAYLSSLHHWITDAAHGCVCTNSSNNSSRPTSDYYSTLIEHLQSSFLEKKIQRRQSQKQEPERQFLKYLHLKSITEKRIFVLSWYTALVATLHSMAFSTELLSPTITKKNESNWHNIRYKTWITSQIFPY